jgi:hypothetical protein
MMGGPGRTHEGDEKSLQNVTHTWKEWNEETMWET